MKGIAAPPIHTASSAAIHSSDRRSLRHMGSPIHGKPHAFVHCLFTTQPDQFGELHAVCPHDDDVPWSHVLKIPCDVVAARLRVDEV